MSFQDTTIKYLNIFNWGEGHISIKNLKKKNERDELKKEKICVKW